jgi:hypothetical protein
MPLDNPFSAAGSALGYLYQVRLALLLFLQKFREDPQTDISIERFDDIAFEQQGVAVDLLQTKHHVNAAANLSDASEDLWRTLRVWCAMLGNGSVQLPGTNFFLITTACAPDGAATSLLRRGKQRDPDKALLILRQVTATSTSKTNKAAYEEFSSQMHERLTSLFAAVTVVDQAPTITDTRSKIENEVRPMLRPAQVAPFVDRLESWWFGRVVAHLSGQDNSIILGTELNAQLSDLRDQFKADNLPIDFDTEDPPAQMVLALSKCKFVEQLKLIALTDRRIRHAISDYYRAFEQRSRWIRDDLVHIGELSRYEKRLREEWRRCFDRETEAVPDTTPEGTLQETGRRIYNWAEASDIRIRDNVRDPYVCRGSFHMLAETTKIGWHPLFVERLQEVLESVTE